MKRFPLLFLLLALAACGTRAPLATSQVSASRLQQTIVPGQTGKAQVLAALGPTTALAFESGYEVWMYHYPAASGKGQVEYVILFGRDGLVKKTRTAGPWPAP